MADRLDPRAPAAQAMDASRSAGTAPRGCGAAFAPSTRQALLSHACALKFRILAERAIDSGRQFFRRLYV